MFSGRVSNAFGHLTASVKSGLVCSFLCEIVDTRIVSIETVANRIRTENAEEINNNMHLCIDLFLLCQRVRSNECSSSKQSTDCGCQIKCLIF